MKKRKSKSNRKSNKLQLYVIIFLLLINIFIIVSFIASMYFDKSKFDKLSFAFAEEQGKSAFSAIVPLGEDPLVEPGLWEQDNKGDASQDNALRPAMSKPVLLEENFSKDSYAGKCMLDYVGAPVSRSDNEVLKMLLELSENDEDMLEIYNNHADYPSKLLENLVNNPEMKSFVKNYKGEKSKAAAGFTDDEINEHFPLLLQWDERWGYVSYGSSVVALSGCGPTCLSMVLFSLTRNENLTPDMLADYAMDNGYYMPGTGTMWALFEDVPAIYGVESEKIDRDEELITQALKDGKMLVFSVRPGSFTAYGHFVVVYGIDDDGLLMINDPNCVYRSTLRWDYKKIKNQIKGVWSFEYNEEIV